MSVWNVTPEKLLSLDLPPNLRIYSPIRELRGIKIGAHKGNNFIITIKKVEKLEQAKEFLSMHKEEFLMPNFFGYQRFGVTKPVSHITGKMLLKKQYWDAIMTYLTFPSIYDDERLKEAKELIEANDFERAIQLLPKKGFLFEKKLLRELSKKRDIKRVIRHLPKFLVNMFIESYQSYLYNLTLSEYRLNGGVYLKDGKVIKLPLIGYNTLEEKIDEEVKEIIKDIISEEGIDYKNFRNKEIPSLNVKGSFREAAITFQPKRISTSSNERKIVLEFSLNKGQYATIILREMFKENIILALYSKLAYKMGHNRFIFSLKDMAKKGLEMLKEI